MNKFEAYKLKPGDRVSIGGSPDLIVETLKLLPGDRFELRTVNSTNPDDVAVFTEDSIYAVEKLEIQAPVVAVIQQAFAYMPFVVQSVNFPCFVNRVTGGKTNFQTTMGDQRIPSTIKVENSPVIPPAPVDAPVERAGSKPKAKLAVRSKPKAKPAIRNKPKARK